MAAGSKIKEVEKFSVFEWKKGEMIFVFTVLLIIFGISFYQLKIGEMKTRDEQRKSDVDLVSRAIRRYYNDHKIYPPEATGSGKILSCGDKGEEVCEWFTGPLVDEDNVVYINRLPRDPLGDAGYTYVYQPDQERQHFKIYSALEYKGDQGYKHDLTTGCGNNVQCSWYVQE